MTGFVSLLLALVLSACASPSYYIQAASGHLDLMRQRQDVTDLLADGSTDPELARRLALTRDIRLFGSGTLGLPETDSYTQYVQTGREAVSWNVIAAPEFSLEPRSWCFPVAGCVPYRGYFEREAAEQFAARLEKKGYDVIVSPAIAYSTLGWFDDPLLDTMFVYSDAQLAGTVFHEMAHQFLYVKSDVRFNESFATFVEETGVRLWLESLEDEASLEEWLAQRQAIRDSGDLLAAYRDELERLYTAPLPRTEMREEKTQVFGRLCTDYRKQVPLSEKGAREEAASDACGFNNASLALADSYRGGNCAFENLFSEAGRDMGRFLDMAAEKSQLEAVKRKSWLEQPCSQIASTGNL